MIGQDPSIHLVRNSRLRLCNLWRSLARPTLLSQDLYLSHHFLLTGLYWEEVCHHLPEAMLVDEKAVPRGNQALWRRWSASGYMCLRVSFDFSFYPHASILPLTQCLSSLYLHTSARLSHLKELTTSPAATSPPHEVTIFVRASRFCTMSRPTTPRSLLSLRSASLSRRKDRSLGGEA